MTLTLAGASVIEALSSVTLATGVNRLVLSYGPTETILVLNGVVIASAAATPSLSALNTFKYARANNAQQPNLGLLRRAYFQRALSQDVARRMTTP